MAEKDERRAAFIQEYGMCAGSFEPLPLPSRAIGRRYYYGLLRERLWRCPECRRFFPKTPSVPWDGTWILSGHKNIRATP